MFKKTEKADELINWALTHKNPAEGKIDNNLIPYNVEQFNKFRLAYHSDYMSSAGLWGFKNINGDVVCSPKFLFEPMCYGENYIVCTGTGWEHYDNLPNDKIWSKKMNWGLINKNFETIIPFIYDEMEWIGSDYTNNDENDNISEIDYFVCRKYNNDKNRFYLESEVRDSKNNLIVSGYSDVDYGIEFNQLVVYKNRERWADKDNPGYAGVYDISLQKEIIKPNKYHNIEIIDNNLFKVSDDVENYFYGTLINEKDEVIGDEKIWNNLGIINSKSNYKYKGKTMDEKFYLFNIRNNSIVDKIEISKEEYLKI